MNQSGSGPSPRPTKFYGGGDAGSEVPLIFISHSAADESIAERLVQFLRSALALRPEQIRCTSVEGHRLRIGAPTDSVLKKELLASRVFVGLISPASIGSAYVLFELGARWGADKTIAPLLAPGAGTDLLKGPLGGMNALSCDSEEQLHQLIQNLSSDLKLNPVEPSAYLSDLRDLQAARSDVLGRPNVPHEDGLRADSRSHHREHYERKKVGQGWVMVREGDDSGAYYCPTCLDGGRSILIQPHPFEGGKFGTHYCSTCKTNFRLS